MRRKFTTEAQRHREKEENILLFSVPLCLCGESLSQERA
jgi:hypothetical protein